MEVNSRGHGRPRQTLLTARDLKLLQFTAQHRLVLAAHAQSLLGVSAGVAQRRLRALAKGGYVIQHRVFAGQPSCYQISRDGLAAVGSELAPPRLDLRGYAHDVGLAWLWLAGQRGAFGPLQEMVGERTLRSEDARVAAGRMRATAGDAVSPLYEPRGIRLDGVGPRGGERLHYPDLVLVTSSGHRVAVELELTRKGEARLEQILIGYASDARISTVLYLVDHPGVGRAVERVARRLGTGSLVHVQPVHQTFTPVDRTADIARARGASREGDQSRSRGTER